MNCYICGAEIPNPNRHQKYKYKKTGRAYCSIECSRKYLSKRSSETMAATNRKYASARMKKNNPMHKPEIREKMRQTLIRIGHHPPVQGGNGKPMPVPQAKLMEVLKDLSPIAEFSQPVFKGKYNGYPTHYKIDIAIPTVKLAIEIDGYSHCSQKRQKQDAKKTQLLESLGWTVLRFANQEILDDVEKVVQSITLKLREIITISQKVS